MLLLLNAIVASLDGFIIGISLKLAKTKLTIINNIILFLTNLIIYAGIILLYVFLHFKFMTPFITTILYLYLAWNAYNNKENNNFNTFLTIKQTVLIATTHSLDGSIISLNFVYNYNIILIISLFSFLAIFFLLLGYYFANLFKNIKHTNLINFMLFILLAILNLIL